MSNQLLPCPFCGHDEPTHDEGDESAWVQCTNAECGMCGPITSGPSLAAAAWNRRATQPAAGEPVYQWNARAAWIDSSERGIRIAKENGHQTRVLWKDPPAAAHGDEAVRKDAEAAYVEMTCQPVLIDGATHYYLSSEKMQAFDRLFSVDVSDAAMRAQGDGEV